MRIHALTALVIVEGLFSTDHAKGQGGITVTDRALDELARRVILDAARQEYGSLLAELPEHDFSPEFERKMRRLARRADHPVRYRAVKAAACLLLAALVGGGSLLVLVPEARAAFVGWMRDVYQTWFVYQ